MRIALPERIATIIESMFQIDEKLLPERSLIQQGILSSLQLVELLFELEKEYQISFNLNEMDLSIIDTVNSLGEYINEISGISRMNVRDLFLSICNDHLEETALSFDDMTISYSEFKSIVENLVAHMMEYGITKNTRVAIILPNKVEYIYSYFALMYIGAWPVPINTRWTKHELNNILGDANVHHIICSEKAGNITYGAYVAEFVETNRFTGKVFYFGENFYKENGIAFFDLMTEKQLNHEALIEIQSDDPAILSYTSGTTGIPKGVIMKHNDVVMISLISAGYWWTYGDFSMSIAPLYAAQGFLSMFINFAAECPFKMLSSFNANDILKEVSKKQNTILHTQPTMWTLLLNSRIINFIDFSQLKKLIVSGSLCTPELAKRIEGKIGCMLMNAYGLIEGTSVVTMTRLSDPEDIRYNTVGSAIPGVHLKIVDKDRKELPKGEIGELAVKGYVMQGYYNNPEKTSEVIDAEGWLYTGDLAKYYDDRNICIVGRCKDMIIRGGFNVYPSDIEEYIMQLPDVQTVAVTGASHEILGEEIVAFVVPIVGSTLTENDIMRHLFNKVSNYKLPDKIHLISEMPIILAGKIDKRVLSEWAESGIPVDKQIFFS